jgi:hypothetical protein
MPSPSDASSQPLLAFPGRWVGGVTLILGPALWLLGVLLRLPFHFFFPQQLQAYHDAPARMTASYACVLFGEILTALGATTMAGLIGWTRPGWATWGGVLVVLGLFTRVFHAGIDHLAFQLVAIDGPSAATETIAKTYGAFQPISIFTPAILVGWIVLAIGAYLSRTLPLWRAIALGLTSGLMIGVLKGSTWWSVVYVSGLVIACAPLGVRVLRDGPRPRARVVAAWTALVGALLVLSFLVGRLG